MVELIGPVCWTEYFDFLKLLFMDIAPITPFCEIHLLSVLFFGFLPMLCFNDVLLNARYQNTLDDTFFKVKLV